MGIIEVIIFNRNHSLNKGGFTLAELLVVLVILGIASMVVIPSIGSNNDLKVTAAARKLVADMLYAQTASIADQQKYQVVFDPANHCYEIQDQSGTVVTDPISKTPYRVDYPNSAHLKAVTITSADFDSCLSVWFDRLGAPYSGAIASATPLSNGNIILDAGSNNVTVTVEPITGRIRSP